MFHLRERLFKQSLELSVQIVAVKDVGISEYFEEFVLVAFVDAGEMEREIPNEADGVPAILLVPFTEETSRQALLIVEFSTYRCRDGALPASSWTVEVKTPCRVTVAMYKLTEPRHDAYSRSIQTGRFSPKRDVAWTDELVQ